MRREAMIFGLIATVLLLAACVPIVKTYVCSDGTQVADPGMCQKEAAPPAGEEEIEVKETQSTKPTPAEKPAPPAVDEDAKVTDKDVTADVAKLIAKADSVKNVRFNYFHSDDPYTSDEYYASREKMRIKLVNKQKYTVDDPYDTIYIDFVKKEAIGYCESASQGVCPDRNKKYPLDYASAKIRTPFIWLDVMSKGEATGRSKQIEGRQAKEVLFEANGKPGIVWMDSFFGVPLEINFEGVDYRFQNLYTNDVKDTDLVHPQLTNTLSS
ncbi:hypothetical protein JW826_02280 [Candidatus Woesearchaeota archaeon]|nr:hypothetical protein [Candidatus Woesearchaeota archaeon]